MSQASSPQSEPFGSWRSLKKPSTTFTVERIEGREVVGHYWFPRGRYTLRRGRMSVANLLTNWRRDD